MLNWLKSASQSSAEPAIDLDKLLSAGLEKHRAGDIVGARSLYSEILRYRKEHADALYLQGLTFAAEHNHDRALDLIGQAIKINPNNASYYASAGASFHAQGATAQGISAQRRALALDPNDVETLNDLAMCLLESGMASEAVTLLRRATQVMPNDARSFYHLGTALTRMGDLEAAISAYEYAAMYAPNNVDVLTNLGSVAHARGEFARARSCFEKAVALAPTSAQAHNNLGSALQGLEQVEDAILRFRKAIRLDPAYQSAHANLAQSLQEIGAFEDALNAYGACIALDRNPARRMRQALVLPIIPASNEEITYARQRTSAALDQLLNSSEPIAHPETDVATCNFHLAYHGLNDRELQTKTSQTYLTLCPTLDWTAPNIDKMRRRTGRIRVGFISRFLRTHSIGKTSRGLIAELNRSEFETFAIHTAPPANDAIGTFIQARAEHSVVVPAVLETARDLITALELDVLFYQDIGMDPFTYYLAHSRLAPTQCVSFGHPDTTGIPNMDWWVSSENFEPTDAQDHYSEQLWLAADVGTLAFYYRPELPARFKSRDELGLPSDRHMYFCPHTPFRISTEFDQIIGAILERDSKGDVWLIEGRQTAWTRLLLKRMERTLGANIDRVKVLPVQPHQTYLNLMHTADAVLDPIWFNGMNNSLDAFAAGVPVVTLPHLFQRGRHSLGMYKKMDWLECVADDAADYARIAVALANEADFRTHQRQAVVERRDSLFEDLRVVREFERFFHQVSQR